MREGISRVYNQSMTPRDAGQGAGLVPAAPVESAEDGRGELGRGRKR